MEHAAGQMGRWRAGHSVHIMRRCNTKEGDPETEKPRAREEPEEIKQGADLGRDEEDWGDEAEQLRQS